MWRLVTCLALASFVHGQSEAKILKLGKPIEREMRGGEKHHYKVHAKAFGAHQKLPTCARIELPRQESAL